MAKQDADIAYNAITLHFECSFKLLKFRGACRYRLQAEIKPVNLIRIMPAKGERFTPANRPPVFS
jgi:hypothetical protein